MTNSKQQARPDSQKARFSQLTARILRSRPVTVEQVTEIGSLALDLAVIKRQELARGKLIVFPTSPPQPEANSVLMQVAKALTELTGQKGPLQ